MSYSPPPNNPRDVAEDWHEQAWCDQCGLERRITGLMGPRLVSLSTCGHVVGRPVYHEEMD